MISPMFYIYFDLYNKREMKKKYILYFNNLEKCIINYNLLFSKN